MKTTMRRMKEMMVKTIGVAMHAILPALPMMNACRRYEVLEIV
jgi:hypothetical protein